MSADADERRVAQLRELLPATSAGIYLDTATRGPLPAETAAAMREAEDWDLRVGRVWDGRAEDIEQRSEEARAVIAALIGADQADIALTHGLDDAMSLAREELGPSGRVIDATSRVGVESVAVADLMVDAIAFAADRWLLAPEGTGALWLADRRAARLSRTLPRTALIGLARSVGWLEMYVGLEWIYARTANLARRLSTALLTVDGVEVLAPPDTLGAICTFRTKNWSSQQAADELSRGLHALVGQKTEVDAVVASVAWFNTADEIDALAHALADLAAHTPETMPRRPSLIVLGDS
jgi:selenocysteine lyase/cysteine desulfurase